MSIQEVHVTYHHEGDGWWAEADELPGFVAAGASIEETRELVHSGLAEYLASSDFDLFETGDHGQPIVSARLSSSHLSLSTGSSAAVGVGGRMGSA